MEMLRRFFRYEEGANLVEYALLVTFIAIVVVIGAGALIPEGMQIPPASMVMGVPGKIRREVTPEEQERFRVNADHYIELAAKYLEGQS